jgi:hypothetical protein
MSAPIFQTQRSRLIEAYKKNNQEIIAHTIPYHSTAIIPFDVVDWTEAPAPGVAMAVLRKDTVATFFTYGVGDQINLGGTGNRKATDAETNLARGNSTNGAEDYVIEGIGFHSRGYRVGYTGASLTAIDLLAADADVLAAFQGDRPICDPAAIMTPPQVGSPFNLEQALFQSFLGQASVELLFDRKRVEKIGTLDLLPQAGAQSLLRANGIPSADNRYKIPEGYLWRKDGQPDCELEIDVRIQNAIVAPINATTLWDATAASVAPTTIWLEVVMRLFGLGVDMPSQN